MHQTDFLAVNVRQIPVSGQVFQRAEYQSERRTQFMRDVRVETKPLVVQFLFVAHPFFFCLHGGFGG